MLDFDRQAGTAEDRARRPSPVLGLLKAARKPRGGSFFDTPADATVQDMTRPIEYEPGEVDPDRERVLPRFSITRQGYDPGEVDDYVDDLEKELVRNLPEGVVRITGLDPGDDTSGRRRDYDWSQSPLLYLLFLAILIAEQALAVHLSFHLKGSESDVLKQVAGQSVRGV